MKIIHNKKVLGIVFLLVLLCIGLCFFMVGKEGRPLTKKQFSIEVKELLNEERKQQQYWNILLEDAQGTLLENMAGTPLEGIAFVDTCNQVYIDKINDLGQSFIDIYQQFIDLEVETNKEECMEDYQQYVTYFEIFKDIGKQLQQFSSVIKTADYVAAIECLQQVQELNKQIPVIQ